jgi:hypothetical protein
MRAKRPIAFRSVTDKGPDFAARETSLSLDPWSKGLSLPLATQGRCVGTGFDQRLRALGTAVTALREERARFAGTPTN